MWNYHFTLYLKKAVSQHTIVNFKKHVIIKKDVKNSTGKTVLSICFWLIVSFHRLFVDVNNVKDNLVYILKKMIIGNNWFKYKWNALLFWIQLVTFRWISKRKCKSKWIIKRILLNVVEQFSLFLFQLSSLQSRLHRTELFSEVFISILRSGLSVNL